MCNQSVTFTDAIIKNKSERWLFLLIIVLMSVAGLIGYDIYLPAMPQIGMYFHQSMHVVQLTLGVYLIGLSMGQLILGPITDRFGRKKLLIVGMIGYFFSSIFCAFSHSITEMIFFRLIQAISSCSGLIIGRAIVGDLFDAKESGKIFSTIFPFVGMSPAISPVIGGFLSYYFGWQSTFLLMALFAAIIAILVVYFLHETLLESNQRELHFKKILMGYLELIKNRKFIAYAAAPCIAYVAYFAYITQSPFLFHAYGYGERAIGSFYIALSFTYVTGNLIGRRLLASMQLNALIYLGFVFFCFGGLLLLVTIVAGFPLYMIIISFSILTFGNGFLIPLGTAGVMSSFSKSTGYASGLLGFIQLGSAATSSSLIGFFSKHSINYFGLYIFFATIVGLLIFYIFINHKKG